MAQPVKSNNNKGFSLVEMLIAIVVIMISMLALLTSVLTSINTNITNELRNTAIRITNHMGEALLAIPITDPLISTGTHTRIAGDTAQNQKGFPTTTHAVRGHMQQYDIQWTVTDPSNNVKQIEIRVDYKYKDQSSHNTAVILKNRER